MSKPMSDIEFVEAAKVQYQRDGEIEVDDGAIVSRGSDKGAYVAAWVWVYDIAPSENYTSKGNKKRKKVQ